MAADSSEETERKLAVLSKAGPRTSTASLAHELYWSKQLLTSPDLFKGKEAIETSYHILLEEAHASNWEQ